MLFNIFNHFNICILTLSLYIHEINYIYCILFVEYLLEESRKRPKNAGGLPNVRILLHLITVLLLKCTELLTSKYLFLNTSPRCFGP